MSALINHNNHVIIIHVLTGSCFYFFRGLQPVPNEEVFKIYEGTHLAITKINPSNFLNVGFNSVCLL